MSKIINKSNIFNYSPSPELPLDRIVTGSNKDYIPFGENNLFPQQAAKLARESVNHRAILNSKTTYIQGKDITSEDGTIIDWLQDRDFKDSVFANALFDYLTIGNGWIEFVSDRKNLLGIFHQDATKIRIHKEGDKAIIHPDWLKYNSTKDQAEIVGIYPNWTDGEDGFLHTLYHVKDYEPEFRFYGVPGWFAGMRAARISKKTNEFNDERLDNKFSIDGMLVVPGISSVEEAERFENKLRKYQGSDKAGKVLPHYLQPLGSGETREQAEFIEFNQSVDGVFMELHNQSDSDLIKIHSWYKSLAAFDESTGFDTQRIVNDYKMAYASTIIVVQQKFLNAFNEVLGLFSLNEIGIFNENPIYVPNDVEYVWEVRKRLGLDYNENDLKQQLFYAELQATKTIQNGPDDNNRG